MLATIALALLTAFVVFLALSVALLYLAPATFYGVAMGLARRWAGLTRREVTLPDGLRFVFLEGGQGEPLLLLHGFGANKDNFVQIARLLRDRYRLIIPDIMGFGESSKPLDADYTAEAQVDRLRALVTALGITQRVHVGGNSMGGLLTLYYGLRHPDSAASLWLLDPAATFGTPDSEYMRIAVQEKRNPFEIKSADDLGALLRNAFAKPPWIPRPILEAQVKEFIDNRAVIDRVFVDTMKAQVESSVAGMTVHTLIVWGDQDKFVDPSGAAILHQLLPNSRVIMMRNMGHIPQMEDPKQTASDYIAFRDSLPPL